MLLRSDLYPLVLVVELTVFRIREWNMTNEMPCAVNFFGAELQKTTEAAERVEFLRSLLGFKLYAQGATLPLSTKALWVSGMYRENHVSIFSAPIWISI